MSIGISPQHIGIGATAILGLGVIGYNIWQQRKANPVNELLTQLQITEWNLPPHQNPRLVKGKVVQVTEPVFNDKTAKEIQRIKQMIKTANENHPLPNLIFIGEAGVGKTTSVEHICRSLNVGFVRVPSGLMESHLTNGSHIVTMRKIFDLASKSKGPFYIILDDGEELVTKRNVGEKAKNKQIKAAHWIEQDVTDDVITQRRVALVNAILEESGKPQRKVSFAVTTNRPDGIDPAFKSRATVINIDPPGLDERTEIIAAHLPETFNNNQSQLDFFKQGRLEGMAQKTEGFTGRNLVILLQNVSATAGLQEGKLSQGIIDGCILNMRKAVENNKTKGAAAPATT